MARQDHVFLFTAESGKPAMAFCSMEGFDKEEARSAILAVLRERKSFDPRDLSYLGALDYREMDDGIKGQLHHFEKYDPVWLIFHN